MIIIFSSESDVTTNRIIDWLTFYGVKFTRINGEEFTSEDQELFIELNESHDNLQEIFIKNRKLALNQIKSIWFWRTNSFKKLNKFLYNNENLSNVSLLGLSKQLKHEFQIVHNFISNNLNYKHVYFDKPKNNKLNKLSVLNHANNLGLRIPSTIITNSKERVLKFIEQHVKIITKPIYEIYFHYDKESVYGTYTSIVDKEMLESTNDKFFYPSLFQEYIDKIYEIRSFFLNGEFYSMAIFSQNDKKTTFDFRKYNFKKMNRMVPYNLPVDIENKLLKLMDKLGLFHGSIDLIKSTNGNYYFLEVNPVGQFLMVSDPCNYNLDQKLVQQLI